MITLTPSGDILLEGLGKVGEWKNCIYYKGEFDIVLNGDSGKEWKCTCDPTETIQQLLTNGFTPKKWEE